MRVSLLEFQQEALHKLREALYIAQDSYARYGKRQIISFTAPTGAGKTITAAALIEAVFSGDENYLEQRDSVFLWLSDSPELNEQSRHKLSLAGDNLGERCVMIAEESFDREILDDGKVYFLNTQKLSKSSRLVRNGDDRNYTIWQTLENTVRKKGSRFFVIIDEAHRGMLGAKAAESTTIMQKFLKGSAGEIHPMPIVVGMSATIERFRVLAKGIEGAAEQSVKVNKNDVIRSGLLKERIVVVYPESERSADAYATLHAAACEWKDKREHWQRYCEGELFGTTEDVNPIFIIQTQNQASAQEQEASSISMTDLGECVSIVEECSKLKFRKGEVVHTFGSRADIKLAGGFVIPYEEPSHIADNKRVMMVFFKENLSTGWDCPRAETMMSFRKAADATYIAQLLGRMVRTPLRRRIDSDETLNDVKLFLPFFDRENVQRVVDELENSENIPVPVIKETAGKEETQTLTRKPKNRDIDPRQGQLLFDEQQKPSAHTEDTGQGGSEHDSTIATGTTDEHEAGGQNVPQVQPEKGSGEGAVPHKTAPHEPHKAAIDREAVAAFINGEAFPTYSVEKGSAGAGKYLRSLFALSRLLVQTAIHTKASEEAKGHVVEMIHQHKQNLEDAGEWDSRADEIAKIRLQGEKFSVSGEKIGRLRFSYKSSSKEIDRRFAQAEASLSSEGVGYEYGRQWGDEKHPDIYKIDVVLFASDEGCSQQLESWAKEAFHELAKKWRRDLTTRDEGTRRRYEEITRNADTVSTQSFRLPDTIQAPKDEGGKLYWDHLFVDETTGTARIKLNSWEERLIRTEQMRDDFVCWIRNVQNARWALCLPYEFSGEVRRFYPDFIVVRKDNIDYVMDILEPHGQQFADSLEKAKALAEYAQNNTKIGRVQLVRMVRDAGGKERLRRLEFAGNLDAQQKVRRALSHEELDHLFETDGFFE